jgi:hypothetical protein
LSIYAKVEKTIIEGVVYYDLKRPRQRTRIADERNQLIGQMLEQKKQRSEDKRLRRKRKQNTIVIL